MRDQQMYEAARVKNSRAFNLADEMVMKYLCLGMIVIRSMVVRNSDSGRQTSEVEVLSLDWGYPGEKGAKSHETLAHLHFRSNSKTGEMSDVLLMDGPLRNEKPLLPDDMVNVVGFVVHEWIERGRIVWAAKNCPQFAGFLMFGRDVLVDARVPHNQFVLPVLCMCLGHLCGSHQQKLDLIEGTTSSSWSRMIRVNALDSLERRLEAFINQARHEAIKTNIGDFVWLAAISKAPHPRGFFVSTEI